MTFSNIPPKVFVTGTDTGIGKTLVSAILMAGLQGKYWKPIQSGLEGTTDTEWVRQVTGLPIKHFLPETYRLALPLSPHESAKAEGICIDLEAFELPDTDQHLIVEGAGGLMVPLNGTHFMIDLIRKLAIPVLLVARSELGTINHTLLSIEQLRKHHVKVLGVVMNGEKNTANREAIEHFGITRVIAEIEPIKVINSKSLKEVFHRCVREAFENCDSGATIL